MEKQNMETAVNNETTNNVSQPDKELPWLSTFQLFSLCVGFIGIQFAWSMQIAFSSRVLEPLGANPFLFGLIWCAGPITGVVVPPIIGALSDRTWTRIGKRKPYIIGGTIIAAITLFLFPLCPTLGIATLVLWIMNASANAAQGPYRALVPDNVSSGQQVIANSYINFAYGAGSIISLGVAPVLLMFSISMSIVQQFIMTSVIFLAAVGYSCLMVKEYPKPAEVEANKKHETFKTMIQKFFKYDREIHKLCGVQFLTWIGMMSIYIYLTPFVVHNIYGLPDMSTPQFNQTRAIHKLIDPISQKLEYNNLNISALDGLVQVESKFGETDSKEKYKALNTKLDSMIATLSSDKTYNKDKIDKINSLSLKDPDIEKVAANDDGSKELFALKKAAEYKFLIISNWIFEGKEISKADLKSKKAFLSSKEGQIASAGFENLKKFNLLQKTEKQATNTAQIALVAFNIIALFLSIPLGHMCCKYSKKLIYSISLSFLVISCLFAPFIHTPAQVVIMMTFAGVASATVLSIPYAFLGDYTPKGEEGTLMGIFNMFIAGPQIISAIAVSWIISKFPMAVQYGKAHNWSLAFLIASGCIFLAIVATQFLKEKRSATCNN